MCATSIPCWHALSRVWGTQNLDLDRPNFNRPANRLDSTGETWYTGFETLYNGTRKV